MSRPRAARMARAADAVAVGTPALAVADEDREQLEDLLAELLLAALERQDEDSVR